MTQHTSTSSSHHSHATPAQEPCPGCGACQCEAGGADHGVSTPSSLRGWRLVATTIGLFLVPLVMATIAATVFRANETVQLAATLGALIVGMGATLWAARRLHGADAADREQS